MSSSASRGRMSWSESTNPCTTSPCTSNASTWCTIIVANTSTGTGGASTSASTAGTSGTRVAIAETVAIDVGKMATQKESGFRNQESDLGQFAGTRSESAA